MTVRTFITACVLTMAATLSAAPQATTGQKAAAATEDLFVRVGLTADEAAAARSGQPSVRVIPGSVDSEVAVAGAIRIRGDVERLALWLKDMEAFRRALRSDLVGAIATPARAENFSAIATADLDLEELQRCASGRCSVRIPAAYAARLKDVRWGEAGAPAEAGRIVQQMLADYAAAYQSGGDEALDRLPATDSASAPSDQFKDMLRRATPVWQLAYGFAAYLDDFPAKRPGGVEDRFYWTREVMLRQPVTTLHHVVLQRLPDRSLRLADKQFYASRDVDAALLIAQATPTPDGKSFDLVASLRARVPRAGSVAGRLLRDRIGNETAAAFAEYLGWIQRSFALG